MTRSFVRSILRTFCAFAWSFPVCAQETPRPVVVGERIDLQSSVLQQSYDLRIATPWSYDSGNRRYGVVYVLDGGVHFEHAAASVDFLSGLPLRVPELIVVAVNIAGRNRHFTTPTLVPGEAADFPTSGGADEFMRFMREELMPWVDQSYRTNEYAALVGHSLSGLFVIHALVTEPETFNAYIALSPSLWWNDEGTVHEAKTFFESTAELNAALYMASGAEPLYVNARNLAEVLAENSPDGFRWTLEFKGDQGHNSVAPPALYEGLEMIFDGWDVTNQVFSMFETSTIEDIDQVYRESGQRYGIDRMTPELMLHNFQGSLIAGDRLDEAAQLMLRDPENYTLIADLVDRLINAYTEKGDDATATAFLTQLMKARADNPIVRQRLIDLGIEIQPE